MWLHSLRRLLTTHRALIPGAAAGYAVIFGFLIYGLTVHARLEPWREPRMQAAAARALAPAAHAVAAACAEFAGMGQTPCNAKGNVEVARADLSPRFAAPELSDIQPPAEQISLAPHRFAALEPRGIQSPAEEATPAPHPPTPILLATEAYADGEDDDQLLSQDETPNLSIAYRE